MDARLILLLAMAVLPIALFLWARRRRAPRMTAEAARAGFDAVMSGAPLTDDLIDAVAVHTALNSYRTQGLVEQAFNPDRYSVRTPEGNLMRCVRSKPLWKRSIVFAPGERVALLAVVGSDHAQIIGRL